MGMIQYPPIYIFTFVLILTGTLSVANIGAPPQQFVVNLVFWGALYGAGLWGGWSHRKDKSANWEAASYVLVGIALLIALKDYYMDGAVKALLSFLMWIQAGRNFTLSNRRELYSAYAISLVLFLYAASVAMRSTFVLYIIIYTLAGIFVLLADHVDQKLSASQGGDRVTMMGGMELPLKVWNLGVMILLVAMAIYFAVPKPASPRIQAFPAGGAWFYKNSAWDRELQTREGGKEQSGSASRQGTGGGGSGSGDESNYEGFGEEFDIGGAGAAYRVNKKSNDILFFLKSNHEIYARGKVFETFDGRTWTRHDQDDLILRPDGEQFFIKPSYGDLKSVQIYRIEKRLPPLIFAAYKPLNVWFTGAMLKKDKNLSIAAPAELRRGTIYSVESLVKTVNERPSGGYETLFYSERYLQMPADQSPEIVALGEAVTMDVTGDYERAEAIEAYLRKNYQLSLDTLMRDPESNSLYRFLMDEKSGHSELFSSSMVILLRTVGIPARLVTGYIARGHNYNPITGNYEVRRSDAHSWVEAYIEAHGWVSFEPTAGMELPRTVVRRTVFWSFVEYVGEKIKRAIESHPEAWWSQLLQSIMAAIYAVWASLLSIGQLVSIIALALWAWFVTIGWMILLIALGVAAFSVYGILVSVPTWRQWQIERMKGGDPRQFIYACYMDMERIFTRKGLPRTPSVAPAEYEDLLARKFEIPAPQIATLTRLFQAARYGPSPVGTKEADEVHLAYRRLIQWVSTGKPLSS
jgi:protein-glutamine gamma-glutamyltransferase